MKLETGLSFPSRWAPTAPNARNPPSSAWTLPMPRVLPGRESSEGSTLRHVRHCSSSKRRLSGGGKRKTKNTWDVFGVWANPQSVQTALINMKFTQTSNLHEEFAPLGRCLEGSFGPLGSPRTVDTGLPHRCENASDGIRRNGRFTAFPSLPSILSIPSFLFFCARIYNI